MILLIFDFRYFLFLFSPIILFQFANGQLESELRLGNEIAVVTANPNEEVEEDPDDNEFGSTDYDFTPESSTRHGDTSGVIDDPTSECRGDDVVECPRNPSIKICSVQFCDQVPDCPDGEDESLENCPAGEI